MAAPIPPISRLLALPKELRLLIYEALYPAQHPSDQQIDIASASPPSKAPLLTCKQIHQETKALYVTSFRTYWAASHFIVHRNAQAPKALAREAILSLPLREMQHITHLRILAPGTKAEDDFSAYLVHPNGGWGLISGAGSSPTFRRYRRWTRRAHPNADSVVVPTKAAWDGHGDESGLWETCGRIGCGIPIVNQVLHLLELELVDLEGVWQRW